MKLVTTRLFGALWLISAGLAWAGEYSKPWTVQGDLSGLGSDLSAIVCSTERGFPRQGLMLDDETQSVTPIEMHDGRIQAQSPIPLINDQFNGKPLELDGEGLAYGDGFYFVTGSYGAPRKEQGPSAKREARIRACSRIFRLKIHQGVLEEKVEAQLGLHELIRQDHALSSLRPFVAQPLAENGLTVEGLAYLKGQLFFGLRAPAEPGVCFLVSVAADRLFGTNNPAPATLHRVMLPTLAGQPNPAAIGIRDLTCYRGQLLVLLGPATEDRTDGFSVGRYDPQKASLTMLGQLPVDPIGRPEGLLVLDEPSEATLRLLILFDKLPHGSPRTVLVDRGFP